MFAASKRFDKANTFRNYNATFDDIFFTSIGGETPTQPDFWSLCLNFVPTAVGGCQQKVKKDDQVLFAYTKSTTKHYLKLSGPVVAYTNVAITLTVTDETQAPIKDAIVNQKKTDDNGKVAFTFTTEGTQKLKATKSDSVRSNELAIRVIERS